MCWGKTSTSNIRLSKESKIPVNFCHKASFEVIFKNYDMYVGHLEESITGEVGSLSFHLSV